MADEFGGGDDARQGIGLGRRRRIRLALWAMAVSFVAVAAIAWLGGSEDSEAVIVIDPGEPGRATGDDKSGAVPDSSSSARGSVPSASDDAAAGSTPSCCGEGRVNVFVNARSPFDEWSAGGHWNFFDANYDLMLVHEPYWDSRLEHYDDVLVYDDVYAIYVGSDKAAQHPEWILREADGSPVYIPWGCSGGCPQYAADISHPTYQDQFVADLAELRDRGYPGLLLDDVNMLWRFGDEFGDDVEPIDTNTGEPLAIEDWRRYMAEFLERIRTELPDLQIGHNAIWYADSPSFDDPFIERQIAAADIIELERGATDTGLVAGDGRYGFQSFLAFVDRVHRLGGNVVLLDESAESFDEQWFNLVATLLVNDGGDLVSTEQWDIISPDGFWSGFDTDLGHALGERYLDGGVIRRDFTDGIVLLNEPGRPTVQIRLDVPMWTHDGAAVEAVTLAEREAVVLYRSSAAVARSLDAGAVVDKTAERVGAAS